MATGWIASEVFRIRDWLNRFRCTGGDIYPFLLELGNKIAELVLKGEHDKVVGTVMRWLAQQISVDGREALVHASVSCRHQAIQKSFCKIVQ